MRRASLAALLLLLLAPAAHAAPDAASSVRFNFAPLKAYQDKQTKVSVTVRPRGARCALGVRYADKSVQRGLKTVVARNGRATWSWVVPRSADAGPARVTASCRGAGKVSRTMVIVGGTTVPVKLAVERSGYTQRFDRYSPSSTVSYGILVRNPSLRQSAKEVVVLVNFLDAAGALIGSKTDRIAAINPETTYALGSSMSFQNQIPVARLEIAITSSSYVLGRTHFPALVNIGFEPEIFEPAWLAAVRMEVVNHHATETLGRANFSIVVLDASGEILGGGSAFLFAKLPPGTRALVKGSSGFRAVPFERAAGTLVSVEPYWERPS